MGRVKELKGYLLHGLDDNRIIAHTEVVISAPNLNLVLDVAGVGNRELGSETVDVVEVAVGLVLVLLVELIDIEALIVEPGVSFGLVGVNRGRDLARVRSGGCSLVERTACSGGLGGDILGLGGKAFLLRSGSEIVRHASRGSSSGGVGAHLDGCTGGREDALVLVNLLYVSVCGDASIASDDFL
jgi:hypothetical protein